jgi:hypothetical protein
MEDAVSMRYINRASTSNTSLSIHKRFKKATKSLTLFVKTNHSALYELKGQNIAILSFFLSVLFLLFLSVLCCLRSDDGGGVTRGMTGQSVLGVTAFVSFFLF